MHRAALLAPGPLPRRLRRASGHALRARRRRVRERRHPHRAGRVAERAAGRIRTTGAARHHAGAGPARARRRRRRRRRELARARQAGAGVEEIAHLLAHARLLQGDAQRRAARGGAGRPAPSSLMRSGSRGRAYMALGDGARRRRLRPGAGRCAERQRRLDRSRRLPPRQRRRRRRAAGRRPRGRGPPAQRRALLLRGELTRGQYGLAAAIPWFDRALEVDPGNVDALLERAVTYGDLGRMSDMLADARRSAQPHRRPYPRLLSAGGAGRAARRFRAGASGSTTAPTAPSTETPGRHAAGRARSTSDRQ